MHFQITRIAIIALLSLHVTLLAASGFYFDTHGSFNNSCHVTGCQACGTGQYRLGCGNASMGTCTNCTGIANATYNTHGWFNNSCNFTCNQGFIAGPGRYCSQIIIRYTINFDCTVTVPIVNNASKPFNMTLFIYGVAAQAGCGACGNVTLSPARCGSCSIGYEFTAAVPVVYRRLLASSNQVSVKTSITVDDDKKLVDGAVSQINSTSLTDRLTRSGVGSVTVTTPTVTTQTIVVGPAPPVTPAPTPPSPPPSPPASGDSNIIPIVAGVLGGVLGLGLIVGLVYAFSKGKSVDPVKPVPIAPITTGPRQGSLFAYKQAGPTQGNTRLASKLVFVRR